MCGIVGAVSLGRPIDAAVLQRMNDLQAHRGPDGEGFLLGWVSGGQFHHAVVPHTTHWNGDTPLSVGLGHRRLAILDLSPRGAQPMTACASPQWIVFRSEEHTSELQSHSDLVCRLLLEKKNQ